ncbi:universal stress protein [Pseudodesulfovibrio piezophilus]|uniref:UspA domain protein n=1 Tax=Pseudodesulfovibrio piezophilus (strain DSM 21447 / JCM 15486 / C1TLV30) TaxID=1322246 RepID=M1WLN7_PSEP2|nr:universal stress protein [Pseudodesulfovibrio piezophilus]CCH48180.1 UspA domain protein [Pseudodesulfovibrio piezophilus C1TLV30]
MFNKIMFATSGSPVCDSPAKIAFDLAEREDAELLLFHVLGVPSRGFSVEVTDVRTGDREDLGEDYESWVKEELSNTYDNQLKLYGAKTRILTTVGVPATEILRLARNEGTDMIVMGANTRPEEGGGRYRAIMGNTMLTVSKRARCPVLIVNRPCNTCWNLFSSVVFCTDFSKAADHAFTFALKVAKDVGCPLHIFHAVNILSGELGGKPTQEMIETEIENATEKIKERYLSQITDFNMVEVDVREGAPHVEILKYAREKEGDLIVMAHHSKDIPPEDAEIGTTLEEVVLRSACPVASVNHPDWITD